MGASIKQPPGSKRAKKDELLLRDTSLSRSTANSAAMERMAESHSIIA
jgi:hypothetical protein